MRYLMIVLLLLNSSFAMAAPEGVRIAQLENWDIVVAEDAIPSERFAAQEFQTLLKQATDFHLPIVTSVDKGSNFHIYIGEGTSIKASPVGFDIGDFGPEDLRIIIRNGNIAIAGGRPRGTLYGVYSFLEDYLGVRFLTHDHTHVPRANRRQVIGPINRFYHPPMSHRWPNYKINDEYPTFAARLRCNTETHDDQLGGITEIPVFGHSFYRQVPWKKYAKTNPEFFGMRDGKVITEQKNAQLCLTNPHVLDIVTKVVLDELAANPGQRSIEVSQNDGGYKCQCPNCEKIDRREESGAGTLLLFVNAVAERVTKKYPNVRVGALAYKYSQKPPKNIKAHPNVIIQLTSHDCSITDPIETSTYPASVQFRQDLEGWGRICDHINLWYYNADFAMYHMPIPNMRVLEPNIRYFVDNGVKGIYAQSVMNGPHAGLNDVMNYMTARLLWDPNASSDELMDEFLNLHYGQAGPLIRTFIDRMHDSAEEKGIQHGWVGHARHYGIDRSVVRVGLMAFDKAFEITDDPVIRSRLEKASIGIHMAALSEALPWAWSGKDGKVPPDIARRTRPHFREFFRLCKKYGITHWEEASTTYSMRYYLKLDFGLERDEPW
jgi:hypothetical protein